MNGEVAPRDEMGCRVARAACSRRSRAPEKICNNGGGWCCCCRGGGGGGGGGGDYGGDGSDASSGQWGRGWPRLGAPGSLIGANDREQTWKVKESAGEPIRQEKRHGRRRTAGEDGDRRSVWVCVAIAVPRRSW
eukprot:6177686-Pleurochrysis_carterae.AAC.2